MRQQAPSQRPRIAPFAIIGSSLIACALSSAAFAVDSDPYQNPYQNRYQDRYEDRNERADSRSYDEASSQTDFAQVLSARPLYREVRVSEPRRECWDEPVRAARYDEPRLSGNNAAGAILGAIIGGVAGNSFGSGSGRDVATGIGAVVGASVGSRVGEGAYGRDRGGYTRTAYETQCRTIDNQRVENRVDGYDVTYRYNGADYHTTLPYDPGNRIAVNVDVRPVRDVVRY